MIVCFFFSDSKPLVLILAPCGAGELAEQEIEADNFELSAQAIKSQWEQRYERGN